MYLKLDNVYFSTYNRYSVFLVFGWYFRKTSCTFVSMSETVTPYRDTAAAKKEQVATMFDNISGRYDFLNHFLSLGIDTIWRKKAIRSMKKLQPKQVLDVATGTGDFAFETLR